MATKKASIEKYDTAWYGWKPDLPDQRDFIYKPSKTQKLPKSVDLRSGCPPVYNQGTLGSCTGNAIAAAIEFGLRKQDQAYSFMPSRLFIYYNERDIEGTVAIDNGAEIRNGIKVVNKLGVCPESMWDYKNYKSTFRKRPTPACYKEALKHQVESYYRLNKELKDLKSCLAEGYPFVFGFTVYKEFEGKEITKTGVLEMPKPNEYKKGGHAVLCVGYDDAKKQFLIRNSWDTDWGQGGYFTMPYEYMLHPNLTEDLWMIKMVEINKKKKK